ncbi:MATE family efflux transporter, partial [bacterium]|nr:MATE family efflux transporter [bacterium]
VRRVAAHFESPDRNPPGEPITGTLHRSLLGEVIAMGLPSMASFLMITIYDLVDIFWLAKLGEAPVAAVTAYSAYLWVLTFANMIVGAGSVAFISRRYGADDARGTEVAIKNTFLLKFLVGALAGIAGYLTIGPALRIMGAAPDVIPLGVAYGRPQWFVLGIVLASFSVYTALRGIGRPRLGMYISLAGAVVNLVLDPLLIFGIGPFPELGIVGASVASALGWVTVTGWGCVALASAHSSVRVRWFAAPYPDGREMIAMLRIGMPSGLSSFSMALFGAVIVKLVAVYGTGAVALFGMTQKILGFGRMLIGGLGLGSGALVGQQLGGGRLERAWVTTIVSMRLGAGFLAVFGAFVALAAPAIVSMFFADPELAAPGTLFLRIMVIGLPFAGISTAAHNAFGGAGMNLPPMILQVAVAWAITVPGVLLLGRVANYGAAGAMAGVAIGEVLGALLFIVLIRRGSWLVYRI